MKSLCRILICCLLTLSAGCVFLDTDMISYGQKADGFDEGVVAFNTSDYQAALRMLQAPAENGNVDAQYLLGLIYINGLADGRRNSYMAENGSEWRLRPGIPPLRFSWRSFIRILPLPSIIRWPHTGGSTS